MQFSPTEKRNCFAKMLQQLKWPWLLSEQKFPHNPLLLNLVIKILQVSSNDWRCHPECPFIIRSCTLILHIGQKLKQY